MAGRIRSIKPEILDDEEASSLSDEAWRLWVSLWLLADDAGNARAGDRYLAALVWQDSSRSPRVAAVLRELRKARRVELYENGGERFAHIRNWAKHQRIDNAGKPRVYGPDHEDSTPWEGIRGESPRVSEVRRLTSDLRPPTTTPTNDHRSLSSPLAPDPVLSVQFDFALVYDAYPRKEGRTKGIARLRSQVRTPEAFEQLQRAVRNYAEKVKTEGIEPKFVKHFSTWCGEWKDYVDGPNITARNGAVRGHARATARYDKTSDGTGDL